MLACMHACIFATISKDCLAKSMKFINEESLKNLLRNIEELLPKY